MNKKIYGKLIAIIFTIEQIEKYENPWDNETNGFQLVCLEMIYFKRSNSH